MLYIEGSKWRQWDLHIHTPASFYWKGEKFDDDLDSQKSKDLVDLMIESLNKAKPQVFAIMDYWTFDGWFALKNRLKDDDSPKLTKTILPGIELRLMAPMKGRLNAHVLFSENVKDQELKDFLSDLKVEFPGKDSKNLSKNALIEYARFVADDKLKHHSLNKEKITSDDDYALYAGSIMAELSCSSYKEAIRKIQHNAIGFIPFDTNDGLTEINRNEHYAYTLGLFTTSPIFETRDLSLWEAFSGIKTDRNKKWFEDFQKALLDKPRLAVSGSDAHQFIGTAGDNNNRGYGDYPSEKITWIKADPNFSGLVQAIKEPAKRSFIGKTPPKLKFIAENRSKIVKAIYINKADTSTITDNWLDGTEIKLNPDLVAIIGNKGSGKSALADITALLGNSKQSKHFTFLKPNRFRGRTGEPAVHFNAKMQWHDDSIIIRNLNEDPAIEDSELVKYIPQGHFEELCNDHVSGKSNAFEEELRSVIFSHTDEAIRLGALDFNQLIESQEKSHRDRIDELRKSLGKTNRQIENIEDKMDPQNLKNITEKINQIKKQLAEIESLKPKEVQAPTDDLSKEEEEISSKISQIEDGLTKLHEEKTKTEKERILLYEKVQSYKDIIQQISILKKSISSFKENSESDFKKIDINIDSIISFRINETPLEEKERTFQEAIIKLNTDIGKIDESIKKFKEKQTPLKEKLNAPQKLYQSYIDELKKWNARHKALIGDKESPDTLEGNNELLRQFNELPKQRESLLQQRIKITEDIYDILLEQRESREKLFKPVQDLILSNELIRDGYKLQFVSEIDSVINPFYSHLFSIIKQNSGEFRGDVESHSVIKELFDINNFNEKEDVLNFVHELYTRLENASLQNKGIKSLLRKDRLSSEVYDYLFGLSYLNPRYTLLFQDAQIEQLSPGQRGSLLLIFYLLVDKGNNPIILDQPEENLDNETIVSLLVPVITEAKKNRQIIMVTHNPNLAVVCDAEQIIHCEFERKKGNKITYSTGSIENHIINKKVVDVLEGTMPAFDNRKNKYINSI